MTADFHIDPLTLSKLREFGRRRRRLIVLRGICAAVVSLLGAMLLIAIPDYLFVLSDTTRWLLSAGAYTAAAVAVWVTCVRLMLHLPSEKELARLMETTEPGLHEDLLSAVELGAADADPRLDSPVFRALLQRSVAERVGRLDIHSLLPWGLVNWWSRTALAILAVCIVLAMIPGSPLGTLMTRAMLPMMNIARVSDTIVRIVEPRQLNPLVPQGEAVRITVELEGEPADYVTLQLFREGHDVEKLAMIRQEGERFSATVQMAEDAVDYRVRAGDALTARYTIATRPRPYVTQFEKTYLYPEYTRLAERQITEKGGDLEAIEQTQVELLITTDQPVAEAALQVEPGNISLTRVSPTQFRGTVPLEKSGTYKVHLIAAETQFENRFSPSYEIIVTPDLVPRVEITQPRQSLLLPPDEIIGLRGEAEDDLGLKEVRQMIRVNGGSWHAVPLAEEPGARFDVSRAWDLLDLKISAGDRVTTKLVAVDLKGSAGESDPLQITVAAPGFDSDRLSYLQAKDRAAAALRRLAEVADRQRRAADEAAEKLVATDPADAQAAVYWVNLRAAVQQFGDESDRTFRGLIEALRQMRRGADSHDLALAAGLIARLRHEHLRAATLSISHAEAAMERDVRNKSLKAAQNDIRDAASLASTAITRYADAVAAEVAALAADDLLTLVRDQQRLAPPPPEGADPVAWTLFVRRQGVAVNQSLALQQMLADYGKYFESGERRRVEEFAKRLAMTVEPLAKAIAAPETPDRSMLPHAQRLKDTLEQLHRETKGLEAESSRRLIRARKELADRAPAPGIWQTMRRVGDDVLLLNKQMARLADPKRKPGDALDREQAKFDADRHDLLGLRWPAAVEIAKARASIEESRPDADARFVADLGAAARALDAMLVRYGAAALTNADAAKEVEQQVRRLAPAFRQLEAVHGVAGIAAVVHELGELEQWKITAAAAHTQHPRQWDVADEQLEAMPKHVREADWPREAALLQQVRGKPYAAEVRSELEARRREVRRAGEITEPIALVERDVRAILAMMEPQAAEVRRVLAELTPGMTELMRLAAERARQMEQRAKEAAAPRNERTAEQARQEMAELAQQQRQTDSAVADVMDALRQDANLQDPFAAPGRDRARDADDAAAMIRDPANRAQQAMAQAAAAKQQADQAAALDQASQQQGRLAETLDQLARHFDKMDAGESVADSRAAMRSAERELGIDQGLEQQYEQMERLAEMSQLSPRELMEALEREVGANREMQRELSDVSRNTLAQAESQLQAAAAAEHQQAERLQQLADQQRQIEQSLAPQLEQMKQAAKELAEKTVPAAAEAARAAALPAATAPIDQAQTAAAGVAEEMPAPTPHASPRLADQLEQQVAPLTEAAKQLREASQQAAAAHAPAGMQAAQAAQAVASQAQQMAAQAKAAADAAHQTAEAMQKADSNSPHSKQARQSADQSRGAAAKAQQQADNARNRANQAAQQALAQQADPAVKSATQAMQHAAEAAQHARAAADAAKQVADSPLAPQDSALKTQDSAALARAAAEESVAAVDQGRAAMKQAETAAENSPAMQAARAAAAAAELAKAASQQAAAAAEQAQHSAQQLAKVQPKAEQTQQAAEAAQRAQQSVAQSKQKAQQAVQSAELSMQRAKQQHGPAATQAAQQSMQQSAESVQHAQAAIDAAAGVAKEMASAADRLPELGPAQQQAEQKAQQAAAATQQVREAMKQAEARMSPARHAAEAEAASREAADRAEQLANQARALAEAMANVQQHLPERMAEAAQRQAPLQEAVAGAADDLKRSARHEQRLDNAPIAERIDQAAQVAQRAAEEDVPAAARKLAESPQPAAAQPAVKQAAEAIAESAQSVGRILGGQEQEEKSEVGGQRSEGGQTAAAAQAASREPQASPHLAGTPFEGQSAQWLARALDELDQSLFGQGQSMNADAQGALAEAAQAAGQPQSAPGQPQAAPGQAAGQPGESANAAGQPSSSAGAMSAAAQAQAQAMAAQRRDGMVPGQNPLGQGFAETPNVGASVDAPPMSYAQLPQGAAAGDIDWGKLPPQLARDLMAASRESVSGEYRNMVETYFRVIAEKARAEGK